MAQSPTAGLSPEDAKLKFAVEEITASENLRFFFRTVFRLSGIEDVTTIADPLLMAHAVGRANLAKDIQAIFLEIAPTLYPTLLLEDALEYASAKITDQETANLERLTNVYSD